MIAPRDQDNITIWCKTPKKHTHIVNIIADGITNTTILLCFRLNLKSLSKIRYKKACSTGAKNILSVEKNTFVKNSKITLWYHASGRSHDEKYVTKTNVTHWMRFNWLTGRFWYKSFFWVFEFFTLCTTQLKIENWCSLKKYSLFWEFFFVTLCHKWVVYLHQFSEVYRVYTKNYSKGDFQILLHVNGDIFFVTWRIFFGMYVCV